MTVSNPPLPLRKSASAPKTALSSADRKRSRTAADGRVLQKKARTQTVGALSRAVSARIVHAVEGGHSLSEVLEKTIQEQQIVDRDVALVKEIVYGTLRHRRLLSQTVNQLLTHSIKEQYSVVRSLILCGLYQLVFTRLPSHAVVAATVGACELCRARSFTALVNAVLRRFLREGGHLVHSAEEQIEQSFPDWLYLRLRESYPEQCSEILRQSNAHAPMWIRVETSCQSPERYQELLLEQGIESTVCPFAPAALKLKEPQPVERLPHFRDGYCTVQDLAAQLCVPLLQLTDDLEVLDICAAPGGKSAQILDTARVNLTCCDNDEQRLDRLRLNLSRLKRQPVIVQCDATLSPLPFTQSFDRILLDAPCSGTGVIRRHPDIKWLRRQKDLATLCQHQRQILDNCFKLLKPGGILVYSTCSILPEENELQIRSFLERTPEAEPFPFTLATLTEPQDFYQNLPGNFEGDGFFYARIRRKQG